MWEGRGGNWLGPLGTDVIEMPAGPVVCRARTARLAPWPEVVRPSIAGDEKYRNVGGHFKGYVLDKQERPTFHYILDDVDIQEQPMPVLEADEIETDSAVHAVERKTPAKDLYFLAASGKKIEQKSPGVWRVDDGKLTITLKSADEA